MKKTILTLALMLTMALAATTSPVVNAQPTNKAHVAFKGDSIVVSDGTEEVTVSGIPQKVRDKINDALDDTLTAGDGTTVEIDGNKSELAPEDIKYISDHWGKVAKQIAYASIAGLLALVFLVLLFRYLNRVRRYSVIEKAIMNNYPLDELSLNEYKHSAIYVQQPVVATPPQVGQVPVGTPVEGQSAANPVVMTDMVNWRALMPAVKWLGWGALLVLFSVSIGKGDDPFWPIGLALMFVGVCKGFILYKEQKSLQEAWNRSQQMRPQEEPMREGIPVPPPMNRYNDDVSAND